MLDFFKPKTGSNSAVTHPSLRQPAAKKPANAIDSFFGAKRSRLQTSQAPKAAAPADTKPIALSDSDTENGSQKKQRVDAATDGDCRAAAPMQVKGEVKLEQQHNGSAVKLETVAADDQLDTAGIATSREEAPNAQENKVNGLGAAGKWQTEPGAMAEGKLGSVVRSGSADMDGKAQCADMEGRKQVLGSIPLAEDQGRLNTLDITSKASGDLVCRLACQVPCNCSVKCMLCCRGT